jgi:catechol 2,3-dioxygenase-like lactoylglutathione lyase family enzyme
MSHAATPGISPFFVVTDVGRAIAFYRDRLGFSVTYQQPPDSDPDFAILVRDGAQLFVKSQAGIAPQPNPSRHPHLRWDAFVQAPDPDALAGAFAASGAPFSAPLADTHDGLRGFEITDPDGHVLFFGRPR